LLGFSPGASLLSLSGLCENQDAAAQEGHPGPSCGVLMCCCDGSASVELVWLKANCIKFPVYWADNLMQFAGTQSGPGFARAASVLLVVWD
jgi:hypothetical protein